MIYTSHYRVDCESNKALFRYSNDTKTNKLPYKHVESQEYVLFYNEMN